MRWWHEERTKDVEKLAHPADGTQWKRFDEMYPQFAEDPRNMRFALSTDGMNPFGDILIQGPKQPGFEIYVFLKPLTEDMTKL
ncbi:hypothetical protein U9M48_004045 [Paspalum notatum var. saurae]|uniref:Uncharacterized protein n=1 Tax=Paspalum notatum var. saurae TaxID=547442 RepID=A0AAQ3SKG6_PASNO